MLAPDNPRHLDIRHSRRAFLKFCAVVTSALALSPRSAALMAQVLSRAQRQPVIWLSFQECTGCTESLTRSTAPSVEHLLFDLISLDYHHTLMAAAGSAAEQAREESLKQHRGKAWLIVDGSIPTAFGGACSTIAGEDNLSLLRRCVDAAEAVIAVGSCAVSGGLPAAAPNPTGAMGVGALMSQGLVTRRPLVNLPGCPPIPEVISAVIVHRLAFGRFPQMDEQGRPLVFYGQTIHDRCNRRGHYEAGRFAQTFDDEGARAGWCLLELGCRGPTTHNACATVRWNGVGNPIESGHPCIGCSETGFWDRDSFYRPFQTPNEAAPGSIAEDGRAVYEGNCVYCHSDNPASLETPAEQVPDLLRSGEVRSHRFTLEDADMQALVDYLKESSK